MSSLIREHLSEVEKEYPGVKLMAKVEFDNNLVFVVTILPDTQENNAPVPKNNNPLEEIFSEGLDKSIEHHQMVEQTKIRYPELKRNTRITVEELIRKAAVLKKHLDGETWSDTKDLI
jgi:hypothetical protein